jgi:PAS domain S-box-containing protein
MQFLSEMRTSWDSHLIVLSVAIAIFGSYVALDFAGRMKSAKDLAHKLWFTGGALMMGLAIWTMHFIGMLALKMPMPMTYDESLVALSILAAVAGAGIAFAIMNRKTLDWIHMCAGSMAMGLAISAMHYTGMASMQMSAVVKYDLLLFGLSVLIAITASAAALWIAFRMRRDKPEIWFWQKVGSAIVMGVAISGMHYTGMAAAHYYHTGNMVSTFNAIPAVGPFKLGDLLIAASILFGLALLLLSAQIAAERQKALATAQENEQRFLATFEQAAVGIALVGLKGEWLKLNRKYCEILGYTPDELMGMTFQDITHTDDLQVDERLYQKLLDGEIGHYTMEKRYLRKDGLIVWVNLTVSMVLDEQNSSLYAIAVAEDIMDRKQAQDELQLLTQELEQRVCERTLQLETVNAALKTNEERFRLLVETVKDYAIFMLDPNGLILTWNKGAERIEGYQAEEIIGQPFTRFYPEEAVRADYPAYELKTAREQGRFEDEGWRVRKDGSLFFANVIITALYDNHGTLIGFAKITRDLTRQKQAEETLRTSERQARELSETLQQQSTQLQAVNKELEAFSYSVSHDLRAPLRGIDGFSQVLLEQYADKIDEQGQHYLHRVRQGSQQMGKLIDDMLQLSRLTRGDMAFESINLTTLVKNIVKELQRQEPDRQVEFVIEDRVMVQGDKNLLQAAMQNLLENAWKYTSKHPKARIEFGVMEQQGNPTYFVKDDGAGFDMKYADKLFGAFQRLHGVTEFPGTGVGLATVARIIHRHGGDIWVDAEIEKGACFYFTLGNSLDKGKEETHNAATPFEQSDFVGGRQSGR